MLGVAQVARDLKVSRQAVYGFKSGAFCPSLAIVQRACKVWGLAFDFNGINISDIVFETKTMIDKTAKKKSPSQLDFYHLWGQLQDQKMTIVRTRRVSGAVEMILRIPIPA
jgi:predicted transcriptional regulator